MWQAWTGIALESCRVVTGDDGIRAESVALGVEAGKPWAVRYALRCDAGWRPRALTVSSLGSDDGREIVGQILVPARQQADRVTVLDGEHAVAIELDLV